MNICLCNFYDTFHDRIFKYDTLLVEFLCRANACESVWSFEADLSFVTLLTKTIGFHLATNQLALVKALIAYDGRLWNYRFAINSRVN